MKNYALLKNIPAPRKLSKQQLYKTVSELSAQLACSKAICISMVTPTRPASRSANKLMKDFTQVLGL